ncbi:MAG: hypothetical protein ACKO0Z_20965 [Betaproteobacteria bacterium]
MAILKTYDKQPWEVKDYDIDYRDWLAGTQPADTIANVTTAVSCLTDPPDSTLQVDSVTVANPRVKLMVSGGTSEKTYKVTVRMTTTGVDGFVRKDESELKFNVKDS